MSPHMTILGYPLAHLCPLKLLKLLLGFLITQPIINILSWDPEERIQVQIFFTQTVLHRTGKCAPNSRISCKKY